MKRAPNQHVPLVYYRLSMLSIAYPRDECAVVSAVYLWPGYASEGSPCQTAYGNSKSIVQDVTSVN